MCEPNPEENIFVLGVGDVFFSVIDACFGHAYPDVVLLEGVPSAMRGLPELRTNLQQMWNRHTQICNLATKKGHKTLCDMCDTSMKQEMHPLS